MRAEVDTDAFKSLTSCLDNVFYNTAFSVKEDSIHLTDATPDTAIMADIVLKNDFFNQFESQLPDDADNEKIGFNAENLHKVVKKVSDDTLTIYNDEGKLHISWSGNKISLPILDADVKDVETSNLEFDFKSECSLEKFLSCVDNLSFLEHPIRLTVKDGFDSVMMEVDSNQASGEVVLPVTDGMGEASEALYTENILDDLCDCIEDIQTDDDSARTRLMFSDASPMKLVPECMEGVKSNWFIAPRIEEV